MIEGRYHPLYHITYLAPGNVAPASWLRVQKAKMWTLNNTKGQGHLMEEFDNGSVRHTLRQDIREWLMANQKGDIRILAGYGLVWVSFYDLHDACLFKMFYL